MLLVGDDKAELCEVAVSFNEGVGADHKSGLARRYGFKGYSALLCRHASCDKDNPYAEGLQKPREGGIVLPRQNFGRGHHGALKTSFGGGVAESCGDCGFAGADVPLYQPVHGDLLRHVGQGLTNDSSLGAGRLKGQGREKRGHVDRRNRRTHRLPDPAAKQRQSKA
ncbi:hypothetical protein SDC9_100711 [bioreactor metagenome]|uniref:Uncharacterized protein n=1 Tax=bioreactor metagenome TaxID=1076179 RepID=A0A645ALB7_9ZZZZ